MRKIPVVLGALALALVTWFPHAAQPGAAASKEATPDLGAPPPVAAEVLVHDVVAYTNAVAVGDYVHAVQMAAVTDYVHAVAASEAQAAAAVRSTPSYTAPSSPAPSGGACGGATNGADQYIHRESGGDPYVINGGGHAATPQQAGRAFGCYQILPSTWASSCSDITTYDPASQARCASRLPDSAWAL